MAPHVLRLAATFGGIQLGLQVHDVVRPEGPLHFQSVREATAQVFQPAINACADVGQLRLEMSVHIAFQLDHVLHDTGDKSKHFLQLCDVHAIGQVLRDHPTKRVEVFAGTASATVSLGKLLDVEGNPGGPLGGGLVLADRRQHAITNKSRNGRRRPRHRRGRRRGRRARSSTLQKAGFREARHLDFGSVGPAVIAKCTRRNH
mmetsp:Transcript_75396/g.245226  ORF Transcript_75396/g.245226 Transcript_75396/m.245226 type:complete len:203 (-) Transcript_75396:530-1138(-)